MNQIWASNQSIDLWCENKRVMIKDSVGNSRPLALIAFAYLTIVKHIHEDFPVFLSR